MSLHSDTQPSFAPPRPLGHSAAHHVGLTNPREEPNDPDSLIGALWCEIWWCLKSPRLARVRVGKARIQKFIIRQLWTRSGTCGKMRYSFLSDSLVKQMQLSEIYLYHLP